MLMATSFSSAAVTRVWMAVGTSSSSLSMEAIHSPVAASSPAFRAAETPRVS